MEAQRRDEMGIGSDRAVWTGDRERTGGQIIIILGHSGA